MGGKKWTAEEDAVLVNYYDLGTPGLCWMLHNKRSPSAIRHRLLHLQRQKLWGILQEATNARLREETRFLLNATFSANTIIDPDIKEILGIPIDPTDDIATLVCGCKKNLATGQFTFYGNGNGCPKGVAPHYSESEVAAPMAPEQLLAVVRGRPQNMFKLGETISASINDNIHFTPEQHIALAAAIAERLADPEEECAPCGKVRGWVREWLKVAGFSFLGSCAVIGLVSWVQLLFKAFGG